MAVKRRKFIRVISYLVAVCVVFAAAGFFSQRAKAGYEETLGKVRMTNLGSMCEYFRDISAGLRLLAVSADSSVSESISYVEARVMGAKGCLNGFDSKKVGNISDFLNAVNGFTQNFSGTSEKRKIAIYLSEYAQEVYYHLNDVSSAIINGAYSLTEYSSIYQNDEKPYFEDFVDYSNGNEKELFGAAAPASANVNGSYFDGKEEITEDDAKKIASRASGINSALWRDNGKKNSVYSFCHSDVSVDISKTGLLCRMVNPVPCRTAKLSDHEAEKTAVGYLEKFGYKNMSAVKRDVGEFTASFLFYPDINGVLLMTCPIEIQVCRASGALVFFDSGEYIRNYGENVSAPEVLPDINGILPEGVTAVKNRYCLKEIKENKKICILTECKYNDYNFYIFTDPETLKIIKTENA